MAMKAQCVLLFFLLSAQLYGAQAQDASRKVPRLWRGIDVAGMDLTRKPWEDFYQYANGKWIAQADIPSDRPALYVFTLLSDRNREILKGILEEAAKDKDATADSLRGMVGTFYRGGMAEARREAAGAKSRCKRNSTASLRFERPATCCPRSPGCIRSTPLPAFTSTRRRTPRTADGPSANCPRGDSACPTASITSRRTRERSPSAPAYLTHVGKMFALLGDSPDEAARNAKNVLDFETRLAKVSRTRVELRDPHRNYHLMSLSELAKETPAITKAYFPALRIDALREVNLAQPAFFQEVDRMVQEVPVDNWKTYLRWHLLNAYTLTLSSAFVAEDFHFTGTVLSGIPRNKPRWERVVEVTDRNLGEVLGQLYVAKAFPPEVKAKAEALVQNVKATLRERLASLDWMQPATRAEALRKLDAITVKIGYPTKWRDYSGLKIAGDYTRDVMAARVFQTRHDWGKIGKPTDRTEWEMTPPTVNAYYNPNLNEIVFPAGILQPPFFDAQADDALNYGAIGMVIGHELTHGFDDQGRKFDAAGNLRDWWQPEDERIYKERAALLSQQYAGYVAVDDLHVNGELTLGENIADLGGLKIAYLAAQKTLRGKMPTKIDGFTPQQRFFLSYAQAHGARLMRPEALRLMVKTNPHSPPRFRVLGPLVNMPEFFQAFGPENGRGQLNARPVEIW